MQTSIHVVSLALVLLSVNPTSADFYTERAKVTRACSYTIDRCLQEFRLSNPRTNTLWCLRLGYHTAFVQCLVANGYCTEEEKTALKNGACARSSKPQQTSSAIKISVYGDVSMTTDQCQRQIVTCTFETSIGTVLKQQEQFCDLMNVRIRGSTLSACLAQGCTEAEVTKLNSTACSISQSDRFSHALVATSELCKNGTETFFESTEYSSVRVIDLIRGQRYCEVMNYRDQMTTSECLKFLGCTDEEISELNTAACDSS
ncbi:uncharacterized protein LOC131958273 [Physella acuta]|uniref:uncharacterized protein LOC131958273 n=1 Tax=Physella acuta TaxID=109671 RepID=UPI0027DB0102|nr:uncharacterized protein LOC131958273 [Physella acuta]XP_059179189.1 uncharacterized protein LOC131958273 [Physella acuta]